MVFEKIDINKLIKAEYNPRKKLTSKDKEYQDIKRSIEEFGYIDPIIVNKDNTIIGGHQRLEVLKDLEYKEIDIIKINVSKEKEKALNIALNKISGEWEFEKLTEILEELKENDFNDFLLTGFSEGEFEKMMKEFNNDNKGKSSKGDNFNAGKEKNDLKKVITKLGYLYQIGKHFLLCGDCTKEENVKRLLNGVEPILMITDPPYGVKYDPEAKERKGKQIKSRGKIKNDDIAEWTEAYKLFPGNIVYVWHSGKLSHIFANNIIEAGFEIVSQIIWRKQNFSFSMGDFKWAHEGCWYAVKKGKNHNWQGAKDVSTVWDIKNNSSVGNTNIEETFGHGTQKPIECMLKPIKLNTNIGQCIYDPFVGSGTSLIAAEQSGRICYSIEIDPSYCDVIIKRYMKYTLDETGKEAENIFLIENDKKIPYKSLVI